MFLNFKWVLHTVMVIIELLCESLFFQTASHLCNSAHFMSGKRFLVILVINKHIMW